jgi:hypothetical protein
VLQFVRPADARRGTKGKLKTKSKKTFSGMFDGTV